MNTMSMDDLYENLGQLSSKDLILDVRKPDEYAEGHVKGSRNIPHEQVAEHADELKKYSQVIIHCRSGKRAQVAHEALKAKGLNNLVCIKDSGMMNWVESGYPVET